MNENPGCTSATFQPENYKHSPFIDLYDLTTGSTFVGTNGFNYDISFDYEVAGPIPAEGVELRLYLVKGTVASTAVTYADVSSADYVLVDKFEIDMTDGAKGTTPVLRFTAKAGYRPQIVMVTNGGSKAATAPAEYHTVYVDNVNIAEEFIPGREIVKISFDANGGSAVDNFTLIKGNALGALPSPTKNGSLFDGWYLGNESVGSTYVPTEDITLKAKWVTATASDFGNSQLNGYTSDNYQNIVEKYADLVTESLKDTGAANATMTAANRYVQSGAPAGFESALLLSNSPAVMSNDKSGIAASALLNADGTKFTVKEDTIYKPVSS